MGKSNDLHNYVTDHVNLANSEVPDVSKRNVILVLFAVQSDASIIDMCR